MPKHWTRRQFVKTSLAGAGTLLAGGCTAPAIGRSGSANGDVRVAVVGLNRQGAGHMRTYFNLPGARLVALCDVDSDVLDSRMQQCSQQDITVRAYRDYRSLLDDPGIDAVVLATPNHQHSLQAIWALQARKDVYVEKPLSHNIWEGRQVVEAARRHDRNIIVAGTQNRSSEDIREAVALVRSGELGRVLWARGLCYKRREPIGVTTGPQPVPPTVDYDLWTGPADLAPPRRNSPLNGPIHYDWHWFWNYGGGDIANQGIHQIDVARYLLGDPGLPPTVHTVGGRFGYLDDAETPNTLVTVFDYPAAPLIFEVRGLPMKAGMRAMDRYRVAQVGVILQCEHGYVHISENGAAAVFDHAHKRVRSFTSGGNARHRAHFIEAVKSRRVVHGVIGEAHLSSALCHLGNISYLLGTERANPAIAEAIKDSQPTAEAFGRMLEHLRANEVDTASGRSVLGPLLRIDPANELFSGPEKTLADAANRNPLRKRTGRGAFRIPQFVA